MQIKEEYIALIHMHIIKRYKKTGLYAVFIIFVSFLLTSKIQNANKQHEYQEIQQLWFTGPPNSIHPLLFSPSLSLCPWVEDA